MAENQTFKQITAEELSKEIDDNVKTETHESKLIYNEYSNFNSQTLNQANMIHERVKDDVVSSNNSIISSTPFKNHYNFHPTTDKNNDLFHGAFNNFHNFMDHKNYLINHSKNFLSLPENNKQFVLSRNNYSKTITISSNFNIKNKNIFQTHNKSIKSKNFKILKEEKESNTFISRKSDPIEKNHSIVPNKKIKQNEILFEHLITASEKLFLNGLVSMDELNSLPVKERIEFDSDIDQAFNRDDEKAQRNYSKNKIRKCENKNCDSKGTKKNLKQNWVKIKIAKGKSKWLCNICSKAFKNKQYCYYCTSIYKDNNNNIDGKEWICCDLCDSWHHINCEKINFNKNIDKYLKQNPDYKYICPWCRSKEKNIKEKMKNKKSKKKLEEDINEDTNKGSILGKKLRNNYSNDNFEFLDFKPRILRKKVAEIKPMYNHLSSLNINDNRDIYHDFYKIMNDNSNEN